jgi:lysophospholipase L1-like esterase
MSAQPRPPAAGTAPRPFRRRVRRALQAALLTLLSTCATLLGLELTTRWLGAEAPLLGLVAEDRAFWVYDAGKGWYHQPGVSGYNTIAPPDRGFVRINSLGLRGPEPAARASVRRRVLVLGDSYVFGVGVDEPHLLTTQLAARLGADSEVVNGGVSGYSTDQELLLYRQLAPRLAPDLVILVICDNDVTANEQDFVLQRYYKPYVVLDANEEPQFRNIPVPQLSGAQRVKLWFGQRSRLWNFLRTRRTEQRWLQERLSFFALAVPRPVQNPFRTTTALVRRLQQEVQANGARFLAVNTARVGEDAGVLRALGNRLARAGVDYVDVGPRLERARRAGPANEWDFPDRHWNVRAHAAMAGILAEEIEQRGLLHAPRPARADP